MRVPGYGRCVLRWQQNSFLNLRQRMVLATHVRTDALPPTKEKKMDSSMLYRTQRPSPNKSLLRIEPKHHDDLRLIRLCVFFTLYSPTLSVSKLRSVGSYDDFWIMNWIGFGMKQLWTNRGTAHLPLPGGTGNPGWTLFRILDVQILLNTNLARYRYTSPSDSIHLSTDWRWLQSYTYGLLMIWLQRQSNAVTLPASPVLCRLNPIWPQLNSCKALRDVVQEEDCNHNGTYSFTSSSFPPPSDFALHLCVGPICHVFVSDQIIGLWIASLRFLRSSINAKKEKGRNGEELRGEYGRRNIRRTE